MTSPLVSVIIPVFNTVSTLKHAVRSVCRQTYSNLELILIDDGSTDGSGELCEVLATKDSRIRTIHQPTNQGVEEARYRAIKEAQGKYVMFCDKGYSGKVRGNSRTRRRRRSTLSTLSYI